MHFLQAINSDISVLTVCNKTGGTIKGDIKIKKKLMAVHLVTSTYQRLITVFTPLKMGPIVSPETSVRNYHYSLRNI